MKELNVLLEFEKLPKPHLVIRIKNLSNEPVDVLNITLSGDEECREAFVGGLLLSEPLRIDSQGSAEIKTAMPVKIPGALSVVVRYKKKPPFSYQPPMPQPILNKVTSKTMHMGRGFVIPDPKHQERQVESNTVDLAE